METLDNPNDKTDGNDHQEDPVLRQAWECFALYDMNAGRQQKNFNWGQGWVLTIGVLSTLFVVIHAQLELSFPLPVGNDAETTSSVLRYLSEGLSWLIIALPIVLSVFLAGMSRFKPGNKWILLRGSAEALKREIYRYRTRAGAYSDTATVEKPRDTVLAEQIDMISRRLMRTDVNASALLSYEGPIPPPMYGAGADDDGFSVFTPERYIAVRIGDQLNYYRGKTARLERNLQCLQWGVYIAGGVGTFLAAMGAELWVALTTALSGAFAAILSYKQMENSLVSYNQTATDLNNIQVWWSALTPAGQSNPLNLDKLVEHTEKVLEGELTGWVQQMENALENLRKPTPEQQTRDQQEAAGENNQR